MGIFCTKSFPPRYPQSNGKVEATVKSMKKLLYASWTGRCLDQDKLCCAILRYRNTPCRRTACLLHRNSSATQFKISCQPTTNHSYLSDNTQFPQSSSNNKIPYNRLLPITTPIHTRYQTCT